MELTYAPEFESPWIARTDGPEPFEAYGADPASALAALVRQLEDSAGALLAAACPYVHPVDGGRCVLNAGHISPDSINDHINAHGELMG